MNTTLRARALLLLSLASLVALVAVAPPPALAQVALTATVTGTATDATGGVLADASVTLKNETSGDVRRTKTNAQGYFVITAVPTGTYLLSVEFSGLSTWARKG